MIVTGDPGLGQAEGHCSAGAGRRLQVEFLLKMKIEMAVDELVSQASKQLSYQRNEYYFGGWHAQGKGFERSL